MVFRDSIQDEMGRKMYDFIVEQYGGDGVNYEAEIIFSAIQGLFDGLEGDVVIDSALLHNTAACAWVGLKYDKHETIPFSKSDHDYILIRAFEGLLHTLWWAIWNDKLTTRNNFSYYGYFRIPEWYIEHIQKVTKEFFPHGRKKI